MGSTISSTTLKIDSSRISRGRGFSVFNNSSCFKGSLFNNILILGTKISLLKFKENSLKYGELSISDIKLLTEESNRLFSAERAMDLISLLLSDISFTLKGY